MQWNWPKRPEHRSCVMVAFKPIPWTKDKTDLLVALWRKGLTAGVIARRFPEQTRSSMLGKVWRLRKAGISLPARRGNKLRVEEKEPASVPIFRNKRRVISSEARQVINAWKPGQCRWTDGEYHQGPFKPCHQKARRGTSYCHEHIARMYQLPL